MDSQNASQNESIQPTGAENDEQTIRDFETERIRSDRTYCEMIEHIKAQQLKLAETPGMRPKGQVQLCPSLWFHRAPS